MEQQTQAMSGEIEVILGCPPRPLLESVENVDRLDELGDAASGKPLIVSRESPSQIRGFSAMS